MVEPSGMSSAWQAEAQEEMSACPARQAEPQEGMSSSSARQAEPLEEMSSSSARQDEPMEGISSSSAQQTELRALQAAVRDKQDACEKLAAKLWRCNFIYTPPEQDFDSRRVMGTICSLIDGCNPIHCTALDIAAGRRLYSVVVDSEPTSRLLLRNGNLQTRTTFIPLDNINGHVINRKTLKIAQKIGGGPENVQLALDLVSYDSSYKPAMEWVFGSTLVCRDSETAKNVAFHPAVRCRVVTLDGDIFDPNGTMTGGAKLKGRSVLAMLQELKKMEEDMKTAEMELSFYTSQIQPMLEGGVKYTATEQNRKTSTAGHRPPQASVLRPVLCFPHPADSCGLHQVIGPLSNTPSSGTWSPLQNLSATSAIYSASNVPCPLPLKFGNSSGYVGYLGFPTDLFIFHSIT